MRARLILLTVISLAACAPQYRLPEAASALRQSMSRADAETLLGKMVVPSPDSGGLCIQDRLLLAPGKPIAVDGAVVAFYAYAKTGVARRTESQILPETQRTFAAYAMHARRYHMDMGTIEHVRVIKTDGRRTCAWSRPGYDLLFRTPTTGEAMINVAAGDLDRALAALTVISPSATLSKR